MRFSWASLVVKRPDVRPLYRRIFTNRRLDIAHKIFLRSLIGFQLVLASFIATESFVYFKYIRPLKNEEKEEIERELIEADLAGFKVK